MSCPVSVIIPCYNAAQYLPAVVESVLAQGLVGTEVLIVDDCSTDNSAAVGQALADRHPLVKFFRQRINSGPAAARNLGLRLASGVFVCFLDADDTYAPQFFRTILPRFQDRPELAAVTATVELVGCQREVPPLLLRIVTNSLPSNLMVRRNVADFLGGFPEAAAFRGAAAGEDAAFRKALKLYFKIEHIEQPFVRYLIKPGSHFLHYLDRTEVRDGRLHILQHTNEERDGSQRLATIAYLADIEARIAAFRALKPVPD